MEDLYIKFVGKNNTVRTVVTRAMYEKNYKPKGWVIEAEALPIEELQTTEETEIKNKEKVSKATNKQFDDKLIKGK